MAAFRHLDPTFVGVVDLDVAMDPVPPDGYAHGRDHRDGLVLVRLHGEPLKIVYVDRDPSALSHDELAHELWLSAEAEIREHLGRHGCTAPLRGPEDLNELSRSGEGCTGQASGDPHASVAVIVSTAGREEQLARSVNSLLAQRHECLEVVVVDNTPDSGKAWRAISPIIATDNRVRYVEEPRPGLSVGRNRGVSETDAEFVAFTDDDVVADPSWVTWMLTPFARGNVLATCGMVLPLELETEAQKRFEQYAGFSKGLRRRSYDRSSGPAPGLLLYPFINGAVGTGNSMAFRRAELLAAGGFDPALGAGSPAGSCEETCAFGKVILRGGQIVYEPRAVCWHEHRRDGDALYRQIFGYGTGLGAVLTRALLTDPRFYATAARSLGIAIGMRWRKRSIDAGATGTTAFVRPDELLRARRRGVVRGPLRYGTGLVRTRRLGLRDAVGAGRRD
jgi:glycosyltransferase involved in cell wall biosynthesis